MRWDMPPEWDPSRMVNSTWKSSIVYVGMNSPHPDEISGKWDDFLVVSSFSGAVPPWQDCHLIELQCVFVII